MASFNRTRAVFVSANAKWKCPAAAASISFQIINYGGAIIAKQPQETDQGNELSRRKTLTKNEPLFK